MVTQLLKPAVVGLALAGATLPDVRGGDPVPAATNAPADARGLAGAELPRGRVEQVVPLNPLNIPLVADGPDFAARVAMNPTFQSLPVREQWRLAEQYESLGNRHLNPREARHDVFALCLLTRSKFYAELPSESARTSVLMLFSKTLLDGKSPFTILFSPSGSELTLAQSILSRDRDGTSMIDRLNRFSDTKTADPNLKFAVVEGILSVAATKGAVSTQGTRGSCVAKSIQNFLVDRDPAEFARITLDLVERGTTTTRSGHELRALPEWIKGKGAEAEGVATVSRVFQCAVMRIAEPNYDPSSSGSEGVSGIRGLKMHAHIFGTPHRLYTDREAVDFARANPHMVKSFSYNFPVESREGHQQAFVGVTETGIIVRDGDATRSPEGPSIGKILDKEKGLILISWNEMEHYRGRITVEGPTPWYQDETKLDLVFYGGGVTIAALLTAGAFALQRRFNKKAVTSEATKKEP